MKKIFFIAFLLLWRGGIGIAQSEKTLVMSLEPDANFEIQCILPGEVEVEEWDKGYVRMLVNIKTNVNEEILEKLILAGRYKAITYNEFGLEYLSLPKVAKQIIIHGVNMEEKFSFKLLVPRGMTVHSALPDYIVGRK